MLGPVSGSDWPTVDLVLGAGLLVLAAWPQLIERLPERGKFDWAGAFGEGFSAPRGSSFEYPLRPVAISLLLVPFVLRGALACFEALGRHLAGESVLPPLVPAIASGFAYTAGQGVLRSVVRDHGRSAA
jgi:hypothetical protein